MEKYVTVSAKIPQKLRKKMHRLGIKPSAIFHKAINDALMQERLRVIKKELASARKIAAKIPIESVVADIREDREGR